MEDTVFSTIGETVLWFKIESLAPFTWSAPLITECFPECSVGTRTGFGRASCSWQTTSVLIHSTHPEASSEQFLWGNCCVWICGALLITWHWRAGPSGNSRALNREQLDYEHLVIDDKIKDSTIGTWKDWSYCYKVLETYSIIKSDRKAYV